MSKLYLKIVEFILITNLLVSHEILVLGKKCPSQCTKDVATCKEKGGKVIGYCTNNMPCCDITAKMTGSCGAVMTNESSVVYFQSPKYPLALSKDLLCTFTFQLKEDSVGIVLDFQHFHSDGVKFGAVSYNCDADRIFLMGFHNWAPPPFCGHLQGYKFVIDDSKLYENTQKLTLHAVMSSRQYFWKIRITQLTQKQCEAVKENLSFANKNNSGTTKVDSLNLEMTPKPTSNVKYTRDAYGEVKARNSNPVIVEVENYNDNFEFKVESYLQSGFYTEFNSESESDLAEVHPLVVNGDNTEQGKVPWQASIRLDWNKIMKILPKSMKSKFKSLVLHDESGHECDLSEGLHRCGGSIISDQEILTAAHCFSPNTKLSLTPHLAYLKVVLGDINKCRDGGSDNNLTLEEKPKKNEAVQEFGIESVVMHYAFDRDVILNDVAIIRLKTKIKFDGNVKPIRMANEDEDFTGHQAFLSGWGRTNLFDRNNTGSDILQSTDNLKVVNQMECKQHTIKYYQASEKDILIHEKYSEIFNTTLCTTTMNMTRDILAGQGDSGGPLVVFHENTSEPVLVGVVSYSNSAVRKVPVLKSAGNFVDYFQSVAYYRNWIDATLCSLHFNSV